MPQRATDILRIKAAVRERDRFRCVLCGMTNTDHLVRHGQQLEVHRTTPGSLYSVESGVCLTLCVGCHGPQPKRKRGQPDLAHVLQTVSFRPRPELLQRLRTMAKREKRSVAKLVEILIEEAKSAREEAEGE